MTTGWPIVVTCSALLGLGGCFEGSAPPPPSLSRTEPVPDSSSAALQAGPPPIQGGTLLIAADGSAVVSDPDHDRVYLVDLDQRSTRQVDLETGSEPGRLAQDAAGRVHVVLRRAGTVTSIDIADARQIETRSVCPAPHGIAYDAAADVIHVACESGELVTLPADGGEASRVVKLVTGLRDVVVQSDGLRVSHFKSARLFQLAADGTLVDTLRPETVTGTFEVPEFPFLEEPPEPRTMEPAVAWRTLSMGDGRTLMVHQRAQLDEIDLGSQDPVVGDITSGGPVGDPLPGLGEESSYGGAFGCTSIVQSTLSILGADGEIQTLPALAGMVLPVDVAVGPDGTLAVVAAGLSETSSFFGPPTSVISVTLEELETTGSQGCTMAGFLLPGSTVAFADAGQAVSVAYTDDGVLVVQSRSPNTLSLYRRSDDPSFITLELIATIALGDAELDFGHDMYHLNAGAGLACASCHPGGGDDGRTWLFSGLGPRRSQSSNVGLEGTEPFHWDGSLPDLGHLVDEVFVGRMAGATPAPDELAALERWMFALRPPTRIRAADDEQAMRGQALFESGEVGCVSCHSGAKFTNNESVDVGTGDVFQVPSLVGVGYRLPVMHDGCAETLRDRFEPSCSGDAHGKTAQLDDDEIDDLVAYLETL